MKYLNNALTEGLLSVRCLLSDNLEIQRKNILNLEGIVVVDGGGGDVVMEEDREVYLVRRG